MFRFPVLVWLLFLSMGCSTLPGENATGTPASAGNNLSVIGQTPVGGNFVLEQGSFQVLDEYTAASGRICRSLLDQRAGSARVACRLDNNRWYLRQTLANISSVKNPQVPVSASLQTPVISEPAGESVDLEVAKPDSVERTLQDLPRVAVVDNETLWRFSKRVTGNALNWQVIAKINGITNVNTLRPGQQLYIPSQLQILARAQGPVPAQQPAQVSAQPSATGS